MGVEWKKLRSLQLEREDGIINWTTELPLNAMQINAMTDTIPEQRQCLMLPCCTVQVEDLNLEANSMTM